MSRLVKYAVSAAALPLLGMAVVPQTASAQSFAESAPSIEAQLRSGSPLDSFYAARDYRPLWLEGGAPSEAALKFLDVLHQADLDGMGSGPRLADEIGQALDGNGWGAADPAEAELMLSEAWVDYVRTLRRPVNVGMTYVDHSLVPAAPTPRSILEAAADAPSLERHVEQVSRLNPTYAALRGALAALHERSGPFPTGEDAALERRLKLNMDRARALPVAAEAGKYIVVDAAAQRLYMYEGAELAGSMDVIVGKPEEGSETPMMAALVRAAALNPYWNVPPDLVRKNIAANVLDQGTSYLRARGYEVLSGWTDGAEILDPETVDWTAVRAGREKVRVRQLPGEHNFMGDIKFLFPNRFGVYLHDTPDKGLFAEEQRTLSSGCVRLSDAPKLARWLYGEMPEVAPGTPEQEVALAEPVPVYITYLTVGVDGDRIAVRDDFYGRDRLAGGRFASNGLRAAP